MAGLIRTKRPARRVRSRRRSAAAYLLLACVCMLAMPAASEDGFERRCETWLEPRAIFGRNYVLDRVYVCRRAAPPAPPVVPRVKRPAPSAAFGDPIDAALQSVSWDRDGSTLGNAQYERSVRAGRRGPTRRDG